MGACDTGISRRVAKSDEGDPVVWQPGPGCVATGVGCETTGVGCVATGVGCLATDIRRVLRTEKNPEQRIGGLRPPTTSPGDAHSQGPRTPPRKEGL